MKDFQLILLGVIVLAGFTTQAQADVIYDLADLGGVNHTVSGSITVTDTAHLDGVLTAGEIVRWSWSITGATINESRSSGAGSTQEIVGTIMIDGMNISVSNAGLGNAITLREAIAINADSYLVQYTFPALPFVPVVPWFQSSFHDGTNTEQVIWPIIVRPLRYATVSAVPEPGSFMCLGLVVSGLSLRRRRRA